MVGLYQEYDFELHPLLMGRGASDRLVEHVHAARLLSVFVWIAADVPKIRNEMIDRLVKAIVEANELAREAPTSLRRVQVELRRKPIVKR